MSSALSPVVLPRYLSPAHLEFSPPAKGPQMTSLGSFSPQSPTWLGESPLSISAPSLEPFMGTAKSDIFIANSLKTHKEKSNSRLAYEGSFYKCAAIRVYTKQLLSSKTLHLISLLVCPGWLLQSHPAFLFPCAATHKAASHHAGSLAGPHEEANAASKE